ncbi:response regulator [Acidimangrovimonas sediminis]|uniref:response regulator n=1 Tax=Acidimangrovimonas sediminis TaxID=2056283 RepID=UPI000C807A67|nr:response regulator [Acidimangrovimonas sediminis]
MPDTPPTGPKDLMPPRPAATPERPLQGLTILLVEDSRFASEALRLMCLRSGARLRRADCLAAAWRHLRTYRPDVLIVDLGLPDGPGTGLIASLSHGPMRPHAVLAISGEATRGPAALSAGADGFIEKPLSSLAAFQSVILRHLPEGVTGAPLVPVDDAVIEPDPIALRDDLQLAAEMLAQEPDGPTRAYLANFLGGIARTAHDPALARAVEGIEEQVRGYDTGLGAEPLERLSRLVRRRLSATAKAPLGTRKASRVA